jgi:hypothetical protein
LKFCRSIVLERILICLEKPPHPIPRRGATLSPPRGRGKGFSWFLGAAARHGGLPWKTPHPALPIPGIATLFPRARVPEVRGLVRGHFHGFWVPLGGMGDCPGEEKKNGDCVTSSPRVARGLFFALLALTNVGS